MEISWNFVSSKKCEPCHWQNDNDDDFFHITCHIDSGLKTKIERGEFVELEKLVTKNSSTKLLTDESRIELVTRGGSIYFAPVHDRDTKINGIRRWQQAFRIYAATYTRTNYEIAAEIWQYVRIIWDYVRTFMILLSGNSWPLNPEGAGLKHTHRGGI